MVWPLSPTVLHKQTSLTAHFSLLSATLLCVNELNSRSWNYFALSDFYWSTSGLSLLIHVDRAIVIEQIFRVPGIAANYAVETLSFTSHWWMVTGDAHCVVAIFYLLFARSITWQCHPGVPNNCGSDRTSFSWSPDENIPIMFELIEVTHLWTDNLLYIYVWWLASFVIFHSFDWTS